MGCVEQTQAPTPIPTPMPTPVPTPTPTWPACNQDTGGTCSLLGCDSFRQATCHSSKCVCSGHACAVSGVCVEQTQAPTPPTPVPTPMPTPTPAPTTLEQKLCSDT